MELALGAALGGVRLHSDARAAQAARDVNAHAFTHGQEIFFGAGRLRPDTADGRRLLAHELAHVVQQADGTGPQLKSDGSAEISRPGDPHEREADRIADHVLRGNRVEPISRVPPRATLQRQVAGRVGPQPGPGTPLADVRDALGEVSPVAGVGNFPKALGILSGLSMPDLLQTMDALYPTGELDLLTWNIGAADQLDVPRLQAAAGAVRGAHTAVDPTAGIPGFVDLPADQQGDILAFVGPIHEATALKEAARFQATGATRQDILQQIGLISRNLAAVESAAGRFGESGGFTFVRTAVDERLKRLRASTDPNEVKVWGAQAAAQLDILTRSATGMAFAAEQLDLAAKVANPDTGVPEYIKGPLSNLGRSYALAAKASDVSSVGYDQLAAADRLGKNLQIDILQATLDDAKRLLVEAKDLTGGKTNLVGLYGNEFDAELAQARQVIDSDPAKALEVVKHMQEHIKEAHEFAIVVNSRAQFDSLLATIEDYWWKCVGHDWFTYAGQLIELRNELRPYRDHWSTLEMAYLSRDPKAQEATWAVIKAERAHLAKLLGRIQAKLERIAHELKILDFVFRVAILTLIALATGGVGVYLTGIAEGAAMGAGATFLFVSAGEALFFTMASTLAFERDPTVSKVIEQFVVNWVTFGAMKGLSGWYRGVLGPAAKTLPGAAGEALLMLSGQAVTSLAIADYQKRKATGQGLTADEATSIVIEGVVVGIATMVGARVTQDLLPGIKASGTRLGRQLADINRMRADLRTRAAAITGKPPVVDVSPPGEPAGTGRPAGAAATGVGAKPAAGGPSTSPGATTPAAGAKPSAGGEPKPAGARPQPPKDIEQVQALLTDDAALLQKEAETLKALEAETSKNPASKEAESVRAAVAMNTAAVAKNEAVQVLSVVEPAGPNEAMCEQGRLDQVAAYHRKNPDLTVTEGVDADGARTLLVTPKDPTKGQPYRITERLTPGAVDVLTKPAEPVTTTPPPAESQFKSIGDLLTEDGQGFKDKTLDDAYKRYTQRKGREKKRAKSPSDWALSQTSGEYRKLLEGELGPDFFKLGKAKINIRDKPRPQAYTPERYLADEAAVRPFVGRVLRAAGIDPAQGIPDGQISQNAFSGAKGVVAEVLARVPEADVLMQVRKQYPNAIIMRGLRMMLKRGGKLTAPKLFTDAVIGYFDGDNLVLLGRFEVKSGPTGGQEATVQFFDWVEGRLEPGSVLQLGNRQWAYGPTAAQRAAGMGTVSGLANAQTFIITPKGAEHLGRGSEMQTVTEHQRIPLETTAPEIEFLTRILLEPYIRPAAPAPAP
jgi:hypothetical protein